MTQSQITSRDKKAITGLGWFSILLGLAEISGPKTMARQIGVQPDSKTCTVLRIYGARELAAGVGQLLGADPAFWLWSRVAGDGLDISSMLKALASPQTNRTRGWTTIAALAGTTAIDLHYAVALLQNDQE
jgi:hypothetical protein